MTSIDGASIHNTAEEMINCLKGKKEKYDSTYFDCLLTQAKQELQHYISGKHELQLAIFFTFFTFNITSHLSWLLSEYEKQSF